MPRFDSDFLRKLEHLSLLSRRVFRGNVLAQRRSKRLGTGIEFADHREYSPGDDFRHIDWGVYARHGELLLRRFQEEEDLHVHVLLDCSRSMATGSPSKFDVACQIAAALGYIALSHLDRVSLVAYASEVVRTLPPTRGKERILTLLRFLDELSPVGADTNLSRSVRGFLHAKPRKGLVLLISDFFDREGTEAGLDLLRYHQHEPQLIQVVDPSEEDPALLGDVELEDVEHGGRRKVTVTEAMLRRYRELFEAHRERLRGYCQHHGLACTLTTTAVPFDDLVVRMLRLGALAS